MRYVFSLRVFKRMDAHTGARIHSFFYTYTHTRTRIHSLFLKLTRGKTMFSHDQILLNPKSYGLVHDVSVKKICLLYVVCRCIDLKVQLITAVSAVLSQIIYQECVAR